MSHIFHASHVSHVSHASCLTALTPLFPLSPPPLPFPPSFFALPLLSLCRVQFSAYLSKYNTLERGDGAEARLGDAARVAAFVDKFYSLVTDLYEWGWGTSFHFSPALPGKGWPEAEAAHEARAGAILGVGPGDRVLDVGCGVGGPMRTVATSSGAHVVGITINEYQVGRARRHNERLGVASQCTPVRGNFLAMPFEGESFDGAYAMEATCHADKLENVYREVFRVLRPGAKFVTYEWVATPDYDPQNRQHVALMDEIVIGNGLPAMHTQREAEEAGVAVGFELLASRDLARAPRDSVAPFWLGEKLIPADNGTAKDRVNPWYARLSKNRRALKTMAAINGACVSAAELVRLAPKGSREIHDLLALTALALSDAGEIGIFTPMHMLVFQKPLENNAATSGSDKTKEENKEEEEAVVVVVKENEA